MNMFEFAVKNKLRFPHGEGVSAEELFDLSVEELDAILAKLNELDRDESVEMQIGIVNRVKNEKNATEVMNRVMEKIRSKKEPSVTKTPEEARAAFAELINKAKKKD